MAIQNYCTTHWYDNDIRFDILTKYLKQCAGEKFFLVLEPIEDTKGNTGEHGKLVVTNLRLKWQSLKFPKINLSIGYNSITSIAVKSAVSNWRGITEYIHIFAKTKTSRYEFIFTNLVAENNTSFPLILSIHRSYSESRLYREIKMRSAMIVANKKLQMLPQEQICEQINGVWNLSSDQGNLGSFFITNIRVVWYASGNELFNISIPFLQISVTKLRDSKFGKALVIETVESDPVGKYVLGFRIDPKEKLTQVHNILITLHRTCTKNPVFGVELDRNDMEQEKQNPLRNEAIEDVEETDDDPEFTSDAFAAYFETGYSQNATKESQVIYCEELGLAIEKPKDGFTLKQLWEVIPST